MAGEIALRLRLGGRAIWEYLAGSLLCRRFHTCFGKQFAAPEVRRRSGGNDCVEAYYHPNMVEDPWRALQGRMDAQQPKQLQLQLQQQQQQPQQPQQPVPPVSAEEAGAAPSSKAPPANMSGLFDEVLLVRSPPLGDSLQVLQCGSSAVYDVRALCLCTRM
jgi:hypothetical protein